MNMVEAGAAEPTIVEPVGGQVERSPSDLLRLVVAAIALAVVLVVEALFGDTFMDFLADLLRGLSALPHWLVQTITVVVRVGAVVLLVAGAAVTVLRGRWRFLLVVTVAAALGAGLLAVLGLIEPASSEKVVPDVVAPGFPSAYGLAAVTAVVTAAAPWISRRWRRLAWTLVGGLTLVRFLSSELSTETVRAVLVGWLAGSAALLLLGGPRRRPTAHAVARGLAAVGLPLRQLAPASVDARGSTPYLGIGAEGERLFVKALGEDERSADLLFRLWRRASRLKFGDEPSFSTLRRAVEHEALVALSAGNVGIRTPRFVALATAEPHGYVLVYEAIDGRSLDRLEPAELTDDLLSEIWAAVLELCRYGIAHRDLRLANVFRSSDGRIWMIDFGFSELAASPLLLTTDVAELMTSTATKVGAARAVDAACRAVGPDVVRSTLARLKPIYLSGATRSALKRDKALLPEIRRLAAAAS